MWACEIDVEPARLSALDSLLSSDELERAGRFHFERDRARFIAARGLLRTILGHYAGLAPESLQFVYSAFGKPSLAPAMGLGRFRFNASASDALSLVVVRLDAEVGVDIERLRSIADALALARRMLAAEEHDELASLPETLRERRFLEHWVRREAFVKLLGLGIGSVHVGIDGAYRLIPIAPPNEDFVAAFATTEPVGNVHCWQWAWSPSRASSPTPWTD